MTTRLLSRLLLLLRSTLLRRRQVQVVVPCQHFANYLLSPVVQQQQPTDYLFRDDRLPPILS